MWKTKTSTTPVVVGALGVTTKDFEKWMKELPGDDRGAEVQKIALMGTAHILRKVLSVS